MIPNCFVKKNQITNCRTVWDEFSCYAVGSCLIGCYLLFIPLTGPYAIAAKTTGSDSTVCNVNKN